MTRTRLPIIAVIGLLILAASVAPAEEPSGVKLLRPDSLVGWQYGKPVAGWTIADGKLTGTAGSTPLLSGFSFGRFELHLTWAAAEDAAVKVFFPQVPDGKVPGGPGLELALAAGDRCGRLTDGKTVLAPGAKVQAAKDKPHTAVVRYLGNKFSLVVDDKRLYEIDVKPGRRFGLGLAITGGEASVSDVRLREMPGKPIFDGSTLDGWRCRGNLGAWKTENGELVKAGGGGSYIQTEKLFGNYTAAMELKMRKGGNSGIGIRTLTDGWPSGDGMELQLLDRPLSEPNHKSSYMAVYGNMPPVGRADKSEQYNRITIKTDGWMLSVWVDGELIQQVNTYDHPELKHRHLKGWIGFQDHGAWIRVRDIRLLEAPEGEGLAAWYPAPPRRATAAVIDRFMNPESLTTGDAIHCDVVTTKIEPKEGDERKGKKGEHVLADLRGPGAVVRIARTSNDGRLAFFFDGEEKPRIECKAGDLNRALPQTTERSDPVPTCLTYKKGLKVVLRDAKAAEYRFDYVTFPNEYQLESYTDPKSGFPRGWLSAANYRAHRYRVSWGGPREYDRLDRPQERIKELPPGASEKVVHVDGTGIVLWWRLLADRKVFDNDDLWLEVTVDGEEEPAVAAPVRFLFPGLTGGANYNNYVFTGKGAIFHNALAMPFGDGITFRLSNRGEKPIKNVGLLLGVEHATDKNRDAIANRMRLRGIFQPANDDTQELINQNGAGRWIGFVYQEPKREGDDKNAQTGIDKLIVDGKPAAGWPAENLDLFFGHSDDFRAALSGRNKGLSWRYLLTAPVDFNKSLVLISAEKRLGNRLALFYMKK